jgi:hypothetical protein
MFDYAAADLFNFYVNNVFFPIFMKYGEIILPFDIAGFGKKEYDIDVSFPK